VPGADVEDVRPALDGVEALREGRPLPADPLGHRRAGDVLDPSMISISHSWRSAAAGAKPTPQLPVTTVVTPCQELGVTQESHDTWAS
jgi:hypothetical protein